MHFKKFRYYCDFKLHWHIFVIVLEVTISKYSSLLSLNYSNLDPKITNDEKHIEKIYKYVGLCLRIRRILGFRDSCFTRSILLCRLLRKSGFNAKINFGTKKADKPMQNDWSTIGHSWVTLNDEEIRTDYPFIFKYP